MKRVRPTYSNVVATIALFFALAGGAYAATQLPKDSVGAAQLKKGAVTPAKLSTRAKAALVGPTGPQGAKGEEGPAGGSTDLAALAQRVRDLETEVTTLASSRMLLSGKVASLEGTLDGVTREGTTLRFSGVNLQLLSGSGSESSLNGLGNLIVGYNEGSGAQTGSGNLIMGTAAQEATSYGSILGGHGSKATGPGTVVFGANNRASAEASTVVGGADNVASGVFSMVGGGTQDEATALGSAAVGGTKNTASGPWSLARGGHELVASEFYEYKP